jgi:hypothetical protein
MEWISTGFLGAGPGTLSGGSQQGVTIFQHTITRNDSLAKGRECLQNRGK